MLLLLTVKLMKMNVWLKGSGTSNSCCAA